RHSAEQNRCRRPRLDCSITLLQPNLAQVRTCKLGFCSAYRETSAFLFPLVPTPVSLTRASSHFKVIEHKCSFPDERLPGQILSGYAARGLPSRIARARALRAACLSFVVSSCASSARSRSHAA